MYLPTGFNGVISNSKTEMSIAYIRVAGCDMNLLKTNGFVYSFKALGGLSQHPKIEGPIYYTDSVGMTTFEVLHVSPPDEGGFVEMTFDDESGSPDIGLFRDPKHLDDEVTAMLYREEVSLDDWKAELELFSNDQVVEDLDSDWSMEMPPKVKPKKATTGCPAPE